MENASASAPLLWKNYSQDKIQKTEFVWIAANDDEVDSDFHGHFLITLDKLSQELFPLVKFMNLH